MSVPHLKNRQLQIPNGLTFYLPAVKWRAQRGASFNIICQQLQAVVRANPALAKEHQWPVDMAGIEDWVDRFNAAICAKMGWNNYIAEDPSLTVPKSSPHHLRESLGNVAAAVARAKALVAGAKTLLEWDESGEPAVPAEQALARATACCKCPHNQKGDFTSWFTVPAAEMIRRRISRAHERNLTTPRDDDLNLCDICFCPLKLKVHVPLAWIKKRLDQKTWQALLQVPGCWIPAESEN